MVLPFNLEVVVVVFVSLFFCKKYLGRNGDDVGQQSLALYYVLFVASTAFILKAFINETKAWLERNAYFKRSRKKIQSWSILWYFGAVISYFYGTLFSMRTIFVRTNYVLIHPGNGRSDADLKAELNNSIIFPIIGLGVNAIYYLFIKDFRNSRFAQNPGPLVKTIGSAFMLVLALIIERFQENKIESMVSTLCFGLLIFCIVQKIRPVTDFGLFNLFIFKSVEITFNSVGLDSLRAWFYSLFCLVLMGAKHWLEVDEEKIRPRCFMDVVIRGYRHGRIVFELYEDLAPNTVKNFKTFCMEADYKKIKFQPILKGIVGFEDVYKVRHSLYHDVEKSNLKHDQVGLLSTPTDTTQPKFFITTSSCSDFYDNKNIVFGKIVKGLGLLKEIEKAMIDNCLPSIEVCNCGVILEGKEDDMSNLSHYPHWLLDDIILKDKEDFTSWLAVMGSLQIVALAESKMHNYERAIRTYKKAQRYLGFFPTSSVDKEKESFLLDIKSYLSKAIEDCLEKQQEQRLKLELCNAQTATPIITSKPSAGAFGGEIMKK